ncbi:hypothetical protein TH66_12655 [Carbonactinospora thermoautotrophica]|uniref:Uncharacterized protein n=1 Tax=Carbonactinospora thermoautotrophica TaxID=1469144 RepID=A0A132N0I6_9ACTN|nr:hypothetical protein TH66_12655 [Carbonactinospora thermoautotrophica]KWX09083.1 hypothetical protein TR74_11745 [Carbonactinospora thermoautotrophica]
MIFLRAALRVAPGRDISIERVAWRSASAVSPRSLRQYAFSAASPDSSMRSESGSSSSARRSASRHSLRWPRSAYPRA